MPCDPYPTQVALLFEGHAFARDLRTYLMGEHLGLLGPDGSFLSEVVMRGSQGKAVGDCGRALAEVRFW